jgi:hypothetical protein
MYLYLVVTVTVPSTGRGSKVERSNAIQVQPGRGKKARRNMDVLRLHAEGGGMHLYIYIAGGLVAAKCPLGPYVFL